MCDSACYLTRRQCVKALRILSSPCTVIEKRLKTSKIRFFESFYSRYCTLACKIQIWCRFSSTMTGKLRYSGKSDFSVLSRKSDTASGFPWGRLRWDLLNEICASLRATLIAIGAIVPPKALLWSGKVINFTLLPFLPQDEMIHYGSFLFGVLCQF